MSKLEVMINTLNIISVSGKEDLDRLLGCILLAEQLYDELAKEVAISVQKKNAEE